jgi:hypothetical protein
VRVRTGDVAGNRVRLLIGEVDTFRLDNLYQLDLRLEKTFQIGPISLTGSAEVFNVTNNNTVLQRFARVGDYSLSSGELTNTDNFNNIHETQSPRILRLGARIAF